MHTVEIKSEAERSLRDKVYTIYSKWIKADSTVPSGSFVKILFKGEHVGYGFYERIGPIGLRVLAYLSEGPPDTLEEIMRWRIQRAYKLRTLMGEKADAGYRLVYADSDGMPGLIIDVYGKTSVIQSSSIGWDSNKMRLAKIIVDEGISQRVYLKNDQRGRKEFGLPVERAFLIGGGEEKEIIREGKANLVVDFKLGQKTGFYLDQRPIREKISMMKLDGYRVLDLFSYNGSFTVHALLSGAVSSVMVEESPTAIKIALENMRLNSLDSYELIRGRVEKICDSLIAKRRKFDLVIADPPAFITSKSHYNKGVRAYAKLIESALKLVEPGGLVYISSCSYYLKENELLEMIKKEAVNNGFGIRLLFHNSPINSCSYTRIIDEQLRYLKGYLFRVE
ncbi:MAG: class I SAM-dependent rRNA methyltransferase [Fervidicoccaceae archaeon]|nr:class I SAM-dependent rRNA methyltransferase [Fervidicoccaceae archaeon]